MENFTGYVAPVVVVLRVTRKQVGGRWWENESKSQAADYYSFFFFVPQLNFFRQLVRKPTIVARRYCRTHKSAEQKYYGNRRCARCLTRKRFKTLTNGRRKRIDARKL